MTHTEPTPHGWKRLIARLESAWQAVFLAIAAEEVLLERKDLDKRLSGPVKSGDRTSSQSS